MKININAELSGEEIVLYFESALTVQDPKIIAEKDKIKAQVLDKTGKWVEFPIEKIKFSYSK